MKEAWWKEAVVYQIYPRSFQDTNGDGVGDLRGMIRRLDYLKQLGVDVIWLSPIYQSPNYDNGYDISDYCAIMQEFGDMADFDELIMQMHRRGLKLMMDLVVNHTSSEHPWFKAALTERTSSYRDYYFFRKGKNGREPNNWAGHFGYSAWDQEPYGDEYFLHLYTDKQPDLNWENPEVHEEVYRIMDFWKRKGVDGFRMDVINYISKVPSLPDMPGEGYQLPTPYIANGPRVHEYLQEMNRRVLADANLMTVGEMVSVDTHTARLYTHEERHELNMVFTFEHMYLDCVDEDKWRTRPWKLSELKECFGRWQRDLSDGCWNSLYLNNHDQPRMVSRFGDDQRYRVQSAKLLATFLHTLQGTPFIYQGEELGMTNADFTSLEQYRDVDTLNHFDEAVRIQQQNPDEVMAAIRWKSRDNARTPMQWDASANAGFTTRTPWIAVNANHVQINVESEQNDPQSVLAYYKLLIWLRKRHKVMVYGDYQPLCIAHPRVHVYERRYEGKRLLVLLNFFAETAKVTLPENVDIDGGTLLIGNYDNAMLTRSISLRPYEAQVWSF